MVSEAPFYFAWGLLAEEPFRSFESFESFGRTKGTQRTKRTLPLGIGARETTGMFKLVGRLATAHPWMICAAWLLAGGAITAFAPAWNSKAQDDDIRFLPDRCPSVRGYHLLEKAFRKEIYDSRVIFAVERSDRRLADADYALVDSLVEDLQHLREDDANLKIGQIA